MEKRILVVEDEAAIRDIVVINLERAGFSVAEAGNGEAALAAAREEAFDAVLLDITLPGIDGFEVCRNSAPSRIPSASSSSPPGPRKTTR